MESPYHLSWISQGKVGYIYIYIYKREKGLFIDGLLELSIRPDLIRRLVPPHAEPELLSRGIDIHNFEPIPLEQLKISPSAI